MSGAPTRIAISLGAALGVAAAFGAALAAPIGITSAQVGAGDTVVPACDTAFGHAYTTSRGNVTTVTVSAIADPACEGGVVRVTVKDASGSSIASAGPQAVPADGDALDNSVTIATSPQPSAALVTGIEIVVEGP